MNEEKIFKKEGDKNIKSLIKESFKWFFYSYIWLAALVIILDFASKWIVVNYFAKNPTSQNPMIVGNSLEVIPHFFYITLSYNKGSSFGIGHDIKWARYVFIAISWIASGAIIYYWVKNLKKNDHWIDCILALVLGGALGNAIDRTFYWETTVGFSGVVDFFQFYIFGYNRESFAIFNVADASLVVGVAAMIAVMIFRSIKEYLEKK